MTPNEITNADDYLKFCFLCQEIENRFQNKLRMKEKREKNEWEKEKMVQSEGKTPGTEEESPLH